jgi:hypothetical protein
MTLDPWNPNWPKIIQYLRGFSIPIKELRAYYRHYFQGESVPKERAEIAEAVAYAFQYEVLCVRKRPLSESLKKKMQHYGLIKPKEEKMVAKPKKKAAPKTRPDVPKARQQVQEGVSVSHTLAELDKLIQAVTKLVELIERVNRLAGADTTTASFAPPEPDEPPPARTRRRKSKVEEPEDDDEDDDY